jgi:hypothetical protein
MALLQIGQQRKSVRLPPFRFRRHIAANSRGFFFTAIGARNPDRAFWLTLQVGEFECLILQ